MSRYTDSYMRNHCIDVFFRYGQYPIHVLTYGSMIPESLNDKENNREIQHMVAVRQQDNEIQGQVVVNQSYLTRVSYIGAAFEQTIDPIITTVWFMPFAKMGFYSYDCIYTNDRMALFQLVARPLQQQNNLELTAFDDIIVTNYLEGEVPESFIWEW